MPLDVMDKTNQLWCCDNIRWAHALKAKQGGMSIYKTQKPSSINDYYTDNLSYDHVYKKIRIPG